MCHFVVLAIPSTAFDHVLALQRRVVRWRVAADEVRVARLIRTLGRRWAEPAEIWLIDPTPGSCACGIRVRGQPVEDEEEMRLREEHRLMERYRRLGWSFSKAERAVNQRREASLRQPKIPSGCDGLNRFIANASAAVGEVGMLAFWCEIGETQPVRLGATTQSSDLIASEPYAHTMDEIICVKHDGVAGQPHG